jgi:hypothetical protein
MMTTTMVSYVDRRRLMVVVMMARLPVGRVRRYHIIHSWSRCEPEGKAASVSLEFGQDQNRFELHLATPEGEKICASMRQFATTLATTLRRGGMERRETAELVAKHTELSALRAAQEQRSDPQVRSSTRDEQQQCAPRARARAERERERERASAHARARERARERDEGGEGEAAGPLSRPLSAG